MKATARVLLLAVLAVGLVSGCARERPRPAMMPQSTMGDFGYSETKLADDRFAILYETPRLRLPLGADERAGAVAAQKQRAYDLALWRAAQLALELGFPALLVEHEDRNADVTVRDEPGYWDPWPYYGYPYRSRHYYGPYDPFYGPNRYFPGYRTASARIVVELQVRLLKAGGASGALDAKATAERLGKAYGSAAY